MVQNQITRHQKGKSGESLAAEFLKNRGMKILGQNVHCALGEIDLVVLDEKTIVFVEVRSRFTKSYGLPQESITISKQKRLTRLAQWYLKRYNLEHKPARFDIIAITWTAGEPTLKWIPNAFEAQQ
jgi:putative endonuclease